MTDPVQQTELILAERLKMLPSQFRRYANQKDIIEMIALDRTRDEEWIKRYKLGIESKANAKLTPEQQGQLLFGRYHSE